MKTAATTRREAAAEIKKTLQYMNSKEYRDVISTAQKEFRSICNRDIDFFNMGKECFRGYVLRLLDEKIKKLYLIDKKVETLVRQELEELKEELK